MLSCGVVCVRITPLLFVCVALLIWLLVDLYEAWYQGLHANGCGVWSRTRGEARQRPYVTTTPPRNVLGQDKLAFEFGEQNFQYAKNRLCNAVKDESCTDQKR